MSFEGDLEHLPLVDVIQLLHQTGKTGTLTLKGAKGESQLVFRDGFIVSANHVNNSIRIGQVMVDMGLLSREALERTLTEQRNAGDARKPIIQMLIENGTVETQVAYQGLEALIEMTIVEVLTWTRGTFCLDVDKIVVSDEYRYFPEKNNQQINMNTQSILMDALRIYDERKRDGTLTSESIFGNMPLPEAQRGSGSAEISAADLGLEELEELESRIPTYFSAIQEEVVETAASRLRGELAGIPSHEQQELFSYLEQLAGRAPAPGGDLGVVLLTSGRLMRECCASVCGPRFICATDDPDQLEPVLDQALSREKSPLLLLDAGEPSGRNGRDLAALLKQKRERFPDLPIALLVTPADYALCAAAQENGVSALLPRPSRELRPDTFIADTINSCRALAAYLDRDHGKPAQDHSDKFRNQFLTLAERRDPPEVTFALLQAACGVFRRGVTMVVVRSELIAERAIGVDAAGAVTSVKLRLSAPPESLYQRALDGEICYCDADQPLRDTMYGAIGAPLTAKALLLPVKSFGRVIAVIYADFGPGTGTDPQLPLLEILSQHAGLVIDNILYRKRCAQK
ncbi:response regulator [Geomonas subterranea]|uniref:response regulator n=1 Tax=Geomonas subterranea TaxID=2847989 RepID=UPI001CD60D23|nr:response regulator [Geomonas fuzhouensis]